MEIIYYMTICYKSYLLYDNMLISTLKRPSYTVPTRSIYKQLIDYSTSYICTMLTI